MMKINILNTYKLSWILLCIICSMLSGCTEDVLENELLDQKSIAFRLNIPFNNQTKSDPLNGLNVKYILTNEYGNVVNNIQSDYNPNNSTIVIEPLPAGNYHIFVLAYNPILEASGMIINDRVNTLDNTWFSFPEQATLLSNEELYYAKDEFLVSTDMPLSRTINLSNILAGIDVEKQIETSYLRNSIQNIEMSIPASTALYSSMALDGTFKGESHIQNGFSIKGLNAVFSMPQISTDSIKASFTTTTQNHQGASFKMVNQASVLLSEGVKSKVLIDLSAHPDSKNGTLFVTQAFHDLEDRGLILQDNEPKSIYYDASQRSFKMGKLLQLSRVDNLTLQSRFYSPRPVKGVSVWSPTTKYGERVLLAYYDSIPAFSNAKFTFADKQEKQEFLLESNSKITLSKAEINELLAADLEIECHDPYWIKIKQIKANWYFRFQSYGGNPDASDGAPHGNWMGIRPVHIREAIALWINIGYMLSMQSFADHLQTFQGRLYGNGGPKDIIDVKKIIPSIHALEAFNIGLVYSGNGVLGMGGGYTWGVYQQSFLSHYDNTGSCNVIFHELGHCIGYSHNSSMSYGPWAEECANNFYVRNLSSFPINNWTHLNSRNNPNIY